MSNLKRFLAMTLVVVMMIGSLAMSVSASRFDDVNDTNDADLIYAIDVLSDLGIIKGYESGDFGVEDYVQRQQMAMFIGRIKTASPEFFESKAKALESTFEDVVDDTFWSAIDYCYANDIIDGRDHDGLIFDPTAEVNLQEAVKMLVSALGYTGLQYPIGYLTQAKEIGLLDGFDLSNIKANAPLTRGEVAALLYNYFLSDYVELKIAYNPVLRIDSELRVTTPVCEKFGITKIEGYVTAVEDFAANIVLDLQTDSNFRTSNNAYLYSDRYFELSTTPISKRDVTSISNPRDITISWVIPDPKYNPRGELEKVEAKQMNYHTQRELLGITEDEYQGIQGGRNLLGLKIKGYVNTTSRKVNVPRTQIIGTKTDVTKDATYASNTLSVSGATKTSFAVTSNINTTEFDLRNNVYSFGTNEGKGRNNATLKTLAFPNDFQNSESPSKTIRQGTLRHEEKDDGNKNTERDESFNGLNKDLITRMIANRGTTPSYKLEYVDNSYEQDGSEYYFVFTPYRLGYYRNDEDSGKERRFAFINSDDSERLYSDKSVVMADDFSKSVSLAKEKAYLYTQQGDYILVQATLTEEYGTFSNTATSVRGKSVTFNVQSVSSTANNYTPYYSTLVLTYDNAMISKATNLYEKAEWDKDSATNLDFKANDNYKLFSLDGNIIFAYRTGTAASTSTGTRYYGVVTDTPTSAYVNNTVYTAIPVYNAGSYNSAVSSATNEVLLVPTSSITTKLSKGTHIVFTKTGTTTHSIVGYYTPVANTTAPTPTTAAFAVITNPAEDKAMLSDVEGGSYLIGNDEVISGGLGVPGVPGPNQFKYNVSDRRVSTTNTGDISHTQAYANSGTVFIVMGDLQEAGAGEPTGIASNTTYATKFRANRISLSDFEKFMSSSLGNVGASGGAVISAAMITSSANTTTTGAAKVVWIVLQSNDASNNKACEPYLGISATAKNFATIQDRNIGTSLISGTYYTAMIAYDYTNGKEITVYSNYGINVGNVVNYDVIGNNNIVTNVLNNYNGYNGSTGTTPRTLNGNSKEDVENVLGKYDDLEEELKVNYYDNNSIMVGDKMYQLNGNAMNFIEVKYKGNDVDEVKSYHGGDRRRAPDSGDFDKLRSGEENWYAVIVADDSGFVQEITLIKVTK